MKVEEQIQFTRLIDLRTRLDRYEDGTVDQLLKIFFKGKNDLEKNLKKIKSPKTKRALRQIQKDLADSAAKLSRLTTQNLTRNTELMAGEALKGMDPIYSWDGKDVQYNQSLGLVDQVANTVQNVPIGGRHLAQWVDETFDNTLALQRTLLASQIQGESYRKVVNSLMATYPNTERELITLARSYLQESVTSAQEALFEENDDIVKAVRWTAVMEIGFKATGRGTCPRCAALDGTIYKNGEPRPPMTLHPRCRCMWSPITLSWDELFAKHRLKDKNGDPITVPEMKQQNRKFVTRKEANIGTGRQAGNVEDVERIAGDFEDYVNQPGKYGVMKSTFGPNRARLVKEGKVSIKDLVDRETGELFTLKQLGYPIKPKTPVTPTKKKPKKPKPKPKPVVQPEAVTFPVPGAQGLYASAPDHYKTEYQAALMQKEEGYNLFVEDPSKGAYYWTYTQTINMDPSIKTPKTGMTFIHEFGHRVDSTYAQKVNAALGGQYPQVVANSRSVHCKPFYDGLRADNVELDAIPRKDWLSLDGKGHFGPGTRFSNARWRYLLHDKRKDFENTLYQEFTPIKEKVAILNELADKELTGIRKDLRKLSTRGNQRGMDADQSSYFVSEKDALTNLIMAERTGAESFTLKGWLDSLGNAWSQLDDVAGPKLLDAIGATNKEKFFGGGHGIPYYNERLEGRESESFAQIFTTYGDGLSRKFLSRYMPKQLDAFQQMIEVMYGKPI